jgi:hypothetical protein
MSLDSSCQASSSAKRPSRPTATRYARSSTRSPNVTGHEQRSSTCHVSCRQSADDPSRPTHDSHWSRSTKANDTPKPRSPSQPFSRSNGRPKKQPTRPQSHESSRTTRCRWLSASVTKSSHNKKASGPSLVISNFMGPDISLQRPR